MAAAPKPPPTPPLARPVTVLYGVGPERAAQLARLEISTVEELLLHRPRRYEDRRRFRPIAELHLGEAATTRGTIVVMGTKWFKQHTKSIFEIVLSDGTARLHCRWWNLPFMEKYFAVGDEVVVFGQLESLKPRTIDHPETEVVEKGEENLIHLNRITPVYPLTEGLPQRWLRSLLWRTLPAYEGQIAEPWPQSSELQVAGCKLRVQTNQAAGTEKPATCNLQPATELPTRAQAVRMLHFPETIEEAEVARRRLALDEFVELQRQIQLRRKRFETRAEALPCGGDNHYLKPFLTKLGFKLTGAQTEVLRQLRKDMSGTRPMRRLLQGDVGSGKTVVAACCALMALESGYSVALMAPTEILAEQHYRNFRSWFEPLGLPVELQTGSRKTGSSLESQVSSLGSQVSSLGSQVSSLGSQVSSLGSQVSSLGSQVSSQDVLSVHAARSTPHASLTIGTHALLESAFTPDHLGLVIIDEQHKFGVAQREQLVRKGHYPHLLVMTATPIPRTLGLTVYGELDVSAIDELPPGRGRVKTFVRTADKLPKVWAFMRGKLAEGRQAYVVYPRVEEASANGVKAVTREFETLRQTLRPFQVGLLHGRLKSREKEAVMAAFRANTVQVLLATSLIEVGVDVPNATLMLVENAEQFGLAQLHQLRGRIGRGAHDSFCILIAAAKGAEAAQRLKVLEETTDGFRVAEADLQLRGPGELLGQQQSGLPHFRFGDLTRDWELLKQARQIATRLVG